VSGIFRPLKMFLTAFHMKTAVCHSVSAAAQAQKKITKPPLRLSAKPTQPAQPAQRKTPRRASRRSPGREMIAARVHHKTNLLLEQVAAQALMTGNRPTRTALLERAVWTSYGHVLSPTDCPEEFKHLPSNRITAA